LRDVLDARIPPEEVAAVAARFSWDTNAARLAEIYSGIVNQPV
jgi:glycosyltransferase involved in cell wall biosynthesis